MFSKTILIWVAALILFGNTQSLAQKEFYPNGNRYAETQKTENFSYTTRWYQNGNKMMEGATRYEKRVGTWQFWYENGNKQYVMYYDSLSTDLIQKSTIGIMVRIVSYNEDGKLIRVENYSNGLPFVNSEYFPNGQLREIVHHEDGVPVGGLLWYANGGIHEMFTFEKDYKTEVNNGREITRMQPVRVVYKEWYENGKVALDGQIDNQGRRVGVWKEYDAFGNVLHSTEN